MTEGEWLATSSVAAMLRLLQGQSYRACSESSDEGSFHDEAGDRCRLCGRSRRDGLHSHISDRKLHLFEDACFAQCGLNLDDVAVQFSPPPLAAALLRDVVGNPFRPVPYDRCWGIRNQGLVIRIASRIYEENDFSPEALLVLADALEEAGAIEKCQECDGKGKYYLPYSPLSVYHGLVQCQGCKGSGTVPHPLLAHLRGSGPHVRGCHIIDTLLGRE